MSLSDGSGTWDFEGALLPHLDAAYNLAHWLTRNEKDAQDLIQEACARAFQRVDVFRGGNNRVWLLKIVRSIFYAKPRKASAPQSETAFDEQIASGEREPAVPKPLLLQDTDSQLIRQALEELPLKFRELLLLRELEGLSYKEIADITGVPLGTMMSTLGCARERLRQSVTNLLKRNSLPDSGQATLAATAPSNPR